MGAAVTGVFLASSLGLLGMLETPHRHIYQRRRVGNEVRGVSIPNAKTPVAGVPPSISRPNEKHDGVFSPDVSRVETDGANADAAAATMQQRECSSGADVVRSSPEAVPRLDAGPAMEKMMHLFRHGTPAGFEQELVGMGEEALTSIRTPDVSSAS